jgi:uncharacterized protein YeeX (DUF496 family)
MSWYKQSELSTFKDRNDINKRISEFKKMVNKLNYLSQYVYQNAPHARVIVKRMVENKIMSSFPEIKEILQAAFEKSLDSYNKFDLLCQEAIDMLVVKVDEMEKDRKDFIEKKLPQRTKERKENGEK